MRPYIYYLPMIVFLITALATGGLIDLKDPRLVRRPGGMWSLPRVLRDEEWTQEGLVARRRLLRGMAIALGVAILSWVVVLNLAGRG